jgi:hypothetical protein
MLFDLQGKRKRVIQVIYTFLALLLGIGLVGLGIGGSANGGIFDALGIGGGSSGSGDSQFESEIDDANSTLETNPTDTKALLALARYSYLSGQQSLEVDDQGNQSLTDESISKFEDATTAWEKYLEAEKGKPDDSVAGLVLQAYSNLAFIQSDPVLVTRTLDGGLEAARIVAEARPSVNSWLQVATFAYLSGDTKEGEKAGQEALKQANQADKPAVEAQLKQVEQQGKSVQQQLKASQGDTEQSFENPLGQLGGTSGTSTTPPPGG